MADDQTHTAPKEDKQLKTEETAALGSANGTDETEVQVKHKRRKSRSSHGASEAPASNSVDATEESESGSAEGKKQKRPRKSSKTDSVAEAEEKEGSDSEEPPAPVGPTHDKDIPGVVASFSSCIVKSSKSAKHGCKEDVNIERFIKAFYDLLPVLRLLGTAFYFVEKDIVQKLEAIAENKKKSPEGDHTKNLIDFIHWEKETNANILKDKNTSARHALRLMRALHFISLFLDKLNEPGVEPKPAAKDAYAVSLHQYHPWSVRTAVSVAFYTLPYRKSFLKELHMDPAASGLFVDFVTCTTRIRDILNVYYDANDWQNLP